MAETTLDGLIALIAPQLGQYADGTATGGSTTTLIDTAARIEPDNYFVGYYLRVASLAEERLVTAHDQDTKTLTVAPAFSGSVTNGMAYTLKTMRHSEFVSAVQAATIAAGDRFMVMKTDESSITFGSAQEYALPADLVMLHSVHAGQNDFWYEVGSFSVIGVPGAYKLHLPHVSLWPRFSSDLPPDASFECRLVYSAMPDLMAGASDTLGIGSGVERTALQFLKEYALYQLHERLMARNATGEAARVHLTQAQDHRGAAMQAKSEFVKRPTQRVVQTRHFPRSIM